MNNSKQKIRGGKYAVWLISEDLPINFAMTIRLRGTLTPDMFQQALGKLQIKHPSSSTRVIKEADGNAYLVADPNLKFPLRIVARQHSKSWVEEVTAEFAQPFDEYNEPPIRFVWLRGDDVSEIIVLCDHAFVDGYSAAYVARDLLMYLGDSKLEVEPNPPSTAMSELLPTFPGKRFAIWQARLKAAFLKLILTFAPKRDNQWKAMVDTAKRPYYLLPWELTLEQTAALVKHSHAQGTTVHAALCTAFLRAFGELHGTSWKRKIQSPIDLRKRLIRPVDESFDLYIHLVEFFVDCAPEHDFWEVAREIKQRLEHYSRDRPIFGSILGTIVLIDELVSVITPRIVAQTVWGVEYDLSISNLGRLDFPVQYGPLKLEALHGPTIGCNAKEVVLGVVTVGGKMHFTMAFTDMTMTLPQAEQIKAKAMKSLADATRW